MVFMKDLAESEYGYDVKNTRAFAYSRMGEVIRNVT